jgi:hypothetical protein
MYYNSVPFDMTKYNDETGRACPITHYFSPLNSAYSAIQTVKQSLADVGLHTLKMVYIDNSQSPGSTTLVMGGTRQTIVIPGYSQGFFRVLGSPIDLDYTIINYAGFSASAFAVGLTWVNAPLDALQWSSQPVNGLQGLPYVNSATGANSAATFTIPLRTGQTFLLSSIAVTGLGSTAGGSAMATITNLGSLGNSTLQYEIAVPAGATVGIQPIVQSFSPFVPATPNLAPVVTLSAFGAGNTNATISVSGIYV